MLLEAGPALAAAPTYTNLGSVNGGNSEALAISSDGSVVLGYSGSSGGERAFRWTQAGGMQTIEQWLTANGVSLGGLVASAAYGANTDGTVVVGRLVNNKAFIARVSSGGSGLVTLEDLASSLVSTISAPAVALESGALVMHGAHSRPLSRRVGAGKSGFWTAGDIGQNNHGDRDGDTGLMEMGGSHNFGPVQVSLSLGRTWSNQNLATDGTLEHAGNYVQMLGLKQLSGNLWGAFGGDIPRRPGRCPARVHERGVGGSINRQCPDADVGIARALGMGQGGKVGQAGDESVRGILVHEHAHECLHGKWRWISGAVQQTQRSRDGDSVWRQRGVSGGRLDQADRIGGGSAPV